MITVTTQPGMLKEGHARVCLSLVGGIQFAMLWFSAQKISHRPPPSSPMGDCIIRTFSPFSMLSPSVSLSISISLCLQTFSMHSIQNHVLFGYLKSKKLRKTKKDSLHVCLSCSLGRDTGNESASHPHWLSQELRRNRLSPFWLKSTRGKAGFICHDHRTPRLSLSLSLSLWIWQRVSTTSWFPPKPSNVTDCSALKSYLLGLLAKIKCSICSYQLNF